jgi:GT2 family glycosyltransferase
MRADTRPGLTLTVVVKCLNEAENLRRCLTSLVRQTAGMQAEIIVVDSRSTDASVAIAAEFPVRIVQFVNAADPRCGSVAQLGFQCARGRFLLIVDGDMELLPGFLSQALAAFAADARLAGVGAGHMEMSDAIEFRDRNARRDPYATSGQVLRIAGCGMYRVDALRELGYFTDRNLHCFEEFELGMRLRRAGWQLTMLKMLCVRHYGHRDPPLQLLARRWRTRYLDGHGEIIRSSLHNGLCLATLRPCRRAAAVVGWWVGMVCLALAALWWPPAAFGCAMALVLPPLGLLVRKRSVARAAYSFAMWQVSALSLVRGFAGRYIDPLTPIEHVVLKDATSWPASAFAPDEASGRELELPATIRILSA